VRIQQLWGVFKPLYTDVVERQLWEEEEGRYLEKRDFEEVRESLREAAKDKVGQMTLDKVAPAPGTRPRGKRAAASAAFRKAAAAANAEGQRKAAVLDATSNLLLFSDPIVRAEGVRLMHAKFSMEQEVLKHLRHSLSLVLNEQGLQTKKLVEKQTRELLLYTSGKLSNNPLKLRAIHLLFRNQEEAAGPLGLSTLCHQELWDTDARVAYTPFDRLTDRADDEADDGDDDGGGGGGGGLGSASGSSSRLVEDKNAVAGQRWDPTEDDMVAGNQDLLRHAGAHIAVLRLLKNKLGSPCPPMAELQKKHTPEQLQLFRDCFELLYYFCMDNDANQRALSTRPVLAQLLGQLPFGVEVDMLLSVLINDNQKACKLVKDTDLERIVKRVVSGISPTSEGGVIYRAETLQLLQALVEDEYGPRSATQIVVARLLKSNMKSHIADVCYRDAAAAAAAVGAVGAGSATRYDFPAVKAEYMALQVTQDRVMPEIPLGRYLPTHTFYYYN
jgi:hypothetical protein